VIRRALLLALLALAPAAVAAAPAAAAGTAHLGEADGVPFPERAFALTLPRPQPLTAADVRVTENGDRISDVSVTPADGAAARRFGIVLAIDTSASMHGRPLQGAVRAARELIARRSVTQPVAIVTFAGQVRLVLPFTTDEGAIQAALGGVHGGHGGSRIRDAAAMGARLLAAAHIDSGSVVLLTDGADSHSVTSVDRAAAAVRDAGARVYAIGLSSNSPDFGALNVLAADSGGEFSAATSVGDLARVYAHLGSRLGHQYLVRYRSAAPPGSRVAVRVTVKGLPGKATAGYRTPRAPSRLTPAFHRGPGETVWLSPGTALLICLLSALLLVAAVWLVLRRRGTTLRIRLADYVAPAEPEEERARRLELLTARGDGEADSPGRRAVFMLSLAERVDVGRISLDPRRLVAWTGAATVLAFIGFPAVTGVGVTALVGLSVPFAVRAYVERRVRRQRELFTEQLPDNLQVMASAMRAGHSFAGALAVVVEDAPEPTASEMRRVLADEQLGVPIDVALGVAVGRMQSRDLQQVALVAELQRETGGNTAEVLERVTDTVRDRVGLRRLVSGLTAQGRLSRWVLTALPVVLLGAMTIINAEYVRPLYTTSLGQVLLAMAAVMVIAGSVVIKRIVDIKV
jgi:tight adherence protein B